MNRQNFLGHLALALTIVLVAAFAGQLRRWERQRDYVPRSQPATNTASTAQEFEANSTTEPEVLVRFREGTSESTIRRVTGELNDSIEDQIESVDGLVAIDDADNDNPEAVADQYRKMTDLVEYAEPNFQISLEPIPGKFTNDPRSNEPLTSGNFPDDPMFSEQWSLANTGQRGGKEKADINALLAWDKKTKGSEEVVVAVLDSGVDYRHPDLVQNIWVRPFDVDEYFDEQIGNVNDEYGYDAITNSGDPMDENGHGTHCAGIIGADGNNGVGIAGINWRVQIMPLKFMSKGGFGTTKDAIEAINYVINRKRAGVNVRVISASWGSTQKSKALEDVIRKAGEEGILFIAASGNASADADRIIPRALSYLMSSASPPSTETTSWLHSQTTARRAYTWLRPASKF
jgi:subtilisin family serine protease